MREANALDEVELIEQRIAVLDNVAFAKLRDWFVEFEQRRWRVQAGMDISEYSPETLRNQTNVTKPITSDYASLIGTTRAACHA